jgi:single-stranded DNA-binding protein
MKPAFMQVAIFGDATVALGRIEKNEKLYAEGSIRISEWMTAAGEKRTGLSMAAWRAERPGIGRNKPKCQISKPSDMPPGMAGNRSMARQAAGGHDGSAHQTQRRHSPQHRYPQPRRKPEFFNNDDGL